MDILWRKLAPTIPKEKHHIFQIIFRAGIIMLMGCVAAAVPKLGPFIDLVGAIFFSLLGKYAFRYRTLKILRKIFILG